MKFRFRLAESTEMSNEYDNEGNQLTREQAEFFKNSKIRDNKGRLLVCYHGTNVDNINVFNAHLTPQFFSHSRGYAQEYTHKYTHSRNINAKGKIYDVYLNISNPFDNSTEEMNNFLMNEFASWCKIKGYEIPTDGDLKHSPVYFTIVDNLYVFLRKLYREGKSKYDGVLVNEGYVGNHNKDALISYVPLFSNQIKSITNKTPTNSNNINEGEGK